MGGSATLRPPRPPALSPLAPATAACRAKHRDGCCPQHRLSQSVLVHMLPFRSSSSQCQPSASYVRTFDAGPPRDQQARFVGCRANPGVEAAAAVAAAAASTAPSGLLANLSFPGEAFASAAAGAAGPVLLASLTAAASAPTGLPSLGAAAAAATTASGPAGAAAAVSGSLLPLIAAAAVPVAKLAMFCGVGAWAAGRGLLPLEGRRVLSSLTLHVFTPCLLFSKLAVGVGLAEVGRLWAMSANMVASHVLGLLLGLLAARVARVPPRLRPQLVLCCGVGNVGNLPFVLLAGLAADPGLPFARVLGPGLAAELAVRYVALSNLTAALIQFPLTYIFLQKPEQQQQQQQPPQQQPQGQQQQSRQGPAPGQQQQVAAPAATALPGWRTVLAGVLTPPTVASLLAVVVASVDWLRTALYGPSGCLRMVGEVTDALGAICIPALLLVLGANLSRGPGVAAGRLPAGCVVAAVATRLLVLPGVCGALLLAAWNAGLLPATDPLGLLVMLVMHATPTAVLVHSMATIFHNAEDEVAALLFWQYAASLLTMPLATGAMLQVVGPAAGCAEAWRGTVPAAAAGLAAGLAGG